MKHLVQNYALAILIVAACGCAARVEASNGSPVDAVNSFVGVSTSAEYGECKTFPGAVAPFGLV